MDEVNRVQGEAEAMLAKARTTAEGLALVSRALKDNGGLEGTTMLRPSSASNPANMMAEALTVCKSLIGNVGSDKLNGNTSSTIAGRIEGDDSLSEVEDESSTTASTTNVIPNYYDKPGFSLQSPKKE